VRRTLFSVKLRDGQEAWRREGYRSVVGIGKKSVYAINDPGAGGSRFLVALDVLTGEEQFRISIDGFDFVPLNSADSGRDPNQRGKIYLLAQDGTIQVIGERT
jgi:outer membrane protein assembly factor BamB